MASVVPIVVVADWGEPGGDSPTGTVTFFLTEPITAPSAVGCRPVPVELSDGALAQQLYANDKDSAGNPLVPPVTMYRVAVALDGAPEDEWFALIPAAPPGSRAVTDAVATQASNLITSATADFTSGDLGAYVLVDNGTTVAVGAQITEIVSASVAKLSGSATASTTNSALLIGASVELATLRAANE